MSEPDHNIVGAIRVLLGTMPMEQQHRALQILCGEITPIETPRAGPVLGRIIQWMPRDTAWTVTQAKHAVAAGGVMASDKEIYNALGYLTRRRQITRIAYGHYVAAA